ncbi:thiamine-phosphate kinase [Glutamicibacter endophyticus]
MSSNVSDESPSVADLGEAGILSRIQPLLAAGEPVLGPGDDAGALKVSGGEILVSTDTITEDHDFRLTWPSGYRHSAFDIGWKSVAQNLSDINAMGGTATGLVTSLSMPVDTKLSWVEDFARGMRAALDSFGASEVSMLGGDLGRSAQISVTTTVLGEALEGKVLRSGAHPGNVVALAGRAGVAQGGLSILEGDVPPSQWTRGMRRLVDGQCRPQPPLTAGPAAALAGATAMLDVSDGLVRDLGRLAKASGVSFELDSVALQNLSANLVHQAQLVGHDPLDWVLYGGEDFGLLATFDSADAVPEEFVVIGRGMRPVGRRACVSLNGVNLSNGKGFDHFEGGLPKG